MQKWLKRERPRKSVCLALGWYVHEIVVGVTKYAREANWILDDLPSHWGSVPSEWKGDGIITLIETRRENKALLRSVQRTRVPVVDLTGQLGDLPYPRVLPDNLAIGRLGAEHFLERGFDQFAFVSVDSRAAVVQERLRGFQQALTGPHRHFYHLDYTARVQRRGGKRRFLSWLAQQLSRLPKPLATMAQYDREALDIVWACQLAGLLVPEEVAVLGVDNDPVYCELGLVPLSSVASNREMIGYEGARLLDRLMHGGRPPEKPIRIEPTGVVVRKSSDIMAVEDLHVAKALGFIAQHYRESIGVGDVVAVSGTSRRSLYLKFAQLVGHSIHREIMRQRLEHAKHLLRETTDKLEVIAQNCGFEGAEVLSKAFRQHTGVSATEFRARQRPA